MGGRRYRGQIDDPLSERGWRQMRDSTAGYREWQVLISSPLKRCAAFAHELGAALGVVVQEDARFKEIGFGVWEGKTAEELCATDPECLTRFWRDPIAHRPDGAEFVVEFRARVAAAWRDVLVRHHGRKVLLVAHAGVIRAILGIVLDVPPGNLFRIKVSNAGLTRIRVSGTGEAAWPELVFHGGCL